MSTAYIGYGSVLSYSTTLGGSYTTMGQVENIDGPDITVPAVKISNQDSTNTAEEKLPGIADAGTLKVTLIYLKTAMAILYTTMYRTQYFWKITYPDASTWTNLYGHISSISPKAPLGDAIKVDLEMEISGKPTWTSG